MMKVYDPNAGMTCEAIAVMVSRKKKARGFECEMVEHGHVRS